MPMHTVLIVAAVAAVAVFVGPAVIRFVSSYRAGVAQDVRMSAAFIPNLKNNTVVAVRGWSEADIRHILADFLPAYDLRADTVQVTAGTDDRIELTFPNDIPPKFLYFLVNYIQYPNNFDLKHRSIGAVGRVVLDKSFGVPDPHLIGQHAEIYVPANDTEFDLVYAKVDTGGVYQISFTNLIWQKVDGARIPKTIAGL